MGYSECDTMMGSRTGSLSSGRGSSPAVRGQTLKSSPFCTRSASKLTQSIVKDHMISHYKKLYSAKAAIDATVPKSLIHSVKYNDQILQERLRKGGRPQSAHSLSQRDSRTLCSSAQSILSVQHDESPYHFSRSSMLSSPRFHTSFHAMEKVYPSFKVGSHNQNHHHPRPASEIKYHSLGGTLRSRPSSCSLAALEDQNCFKTFQDPVQKTYSGDLLQKHSQHFTPEKPFTPKTLKSDKSSYLSKYRYYRAPQRKSMQDCTKARMTRQETYHGSTKTKDYTQELYEPSQGINTEQELSEDEFSSTYLSTSRQHSRVNESEESNFFPCTSRVSPIGGKSPTMKSISAEEEELMYLEFISSVTGDILSRAHISDRVLDRVMKQHIDMNQHRLNKGKMRHLLEVLRHEFEEQPNIDTSGTEPENNGLLDTFLPHLESGREEGKTRENTDLHSYTFLTKNYDSQNDADPESVCSLLCTPETTASLLNVKENNGEYYHLENNINSPLLTDAPDNAGLSEEILNLIKKDTTALNQQNGNGSTASCEETFHDYKAEDSFDKTSADISDLERSLSKSLHVSNNSQKNKKEETEQHANTTASLSDDDF